MRITFTLDESTMSHVLELTGEKRRSKAIAQALQEYVRAERLKQLLALAGTIEFDEEFLRQRERDHLGTVNN